MNYEVTGSRTAYDGKIMKVVCDDIVYHGSGRKSKREVVVKEDFVIIIPALPNGDLMLVTQFRHPFGSMTATFPAGNVDAGEAPEAAARRAPPPASLFSLS
jgi:ADP-ribose pyrophosphatase